MSSYFDARRVKLEECSSFQIPKYILAELPSDKHARILDIGFGPGHFLKSLEALSFTNAEGVDIDEKAVRIAKENGLNVQLIKDLKEFLTTPRPYKYDFITMSHVLEHLPKEDVIPTLKLIYENALSEGGKLFIATPNAQSLVGAYWAYEDWTHHTIFTSGSLYYVLYMAGFRDMNFVDIYQSSPRKWLNPIRFIGLKCYEFWFRFRNLFFANPFYASSEIILTWELKAVAKK